MTIADLRLTRWLPAGTNKWLHDNLATARSRILLGVLAFVVAAAGLTLVDEADSGIVLKLKQNQLQLARLEQLAHGDLWHRRRAETDVARVQAEGRLWEAETDGIARANLQSWIIEQANLAGLGRIEIQIGLEAGANNPLKLRQFSAQIRGRFEPAALFKFLGAIASHDRVLVASRLELQTLPVAHFELVLDAFLRPARSA
jgi:hypothetical protein